MAQALMKRAMGDIPLVTHIQKESAGMNKLYSQSMCSVSQWRSYQAAEAMVSAEVEEVRVEADEIEPGWSQVRNVKVESDLTFMSALTPLVHFSFLSSFVLLYTLLGLFDKIFVTCKQIKIILISNHIRFQK